MDVGRYLLIKFDQFSTDSENAGWSCTFSSRGGRLTLHTSRQRASKHYIFRVPQAASPPDFFLFFFRFFLLPPSPVSAPSAALASG